MGLHDPGRGDPRRRRAAYGGGPAAALAAGVPGDDLRYAARSSTSPRRWSTCAPGSSRPPTARPASAARSAPPSSCRWWPASSTTSRSTCARGISGAWTSGCSDGKEVAGRRIRSSFARADLELCFNRIEPKLRMPDSHLHFPRAKRLAAYSASYDQVRCLVMQGGQGEVKHWAFNDPPRREGAVEGQPAPAGRIPQAWRARRGPAPDDHHPERAHLGRRRGLGGALPGPVRRTRRDLEGGAGLHLARGHARQPLRHAAHGVHDLQAACRTPRCRCRLLADHPNVHVQLLSGGIGTCRRRCTRSGPPAPIRAAARAAAGFRSPGRSPAAAPLRPRPAPPR